MIEPAHGILVHVLRCEAHMSPRKCPDLLEPLSLANTMKGHE